MINDSKIIGVMVNDTRPKVKWKMEENNPPQGMTASAASEQAVGITVLEPLGDG